MKFLGLVLLLISLEVHAVEKFITRIYSISWSQSSHQSSLVKFHNARFGFFPRSANNSSLLPGELVSVEMGAGNQILKVEPIEDIGPQFSINSPFAPSSYHGSILPDLSAAKGFLKSMRNDFIEASTSYQRAHVWAYEEHVKWNLNSQKGFIFFSDDFLRKNTLKWWFYTSTYVKVKYRGRIEERLLDKSLSTRPLSFKKWIRMLSRSTPECKVISKISLYAENSLEQDCYIMKTSMYYLHPEDLKALETEALERVNFFDFEVKEAFLESFGFVER